MASRKHSGTVPPLTRRPHFDRIPNFSDRRSERPRVLGQRYKISSPATRREHKPPSQRNERSRGGRTAKATVALGTLPFFSLMPRSTSRSLFFDQSDIGSFSAMWNGKCIQEFAFSFCDRRNVPERKVGARQLDSSSIRGAYMQVTRWG